MADALTGGLYEIVVEAPFDDHWHEWFDEFEIVSEGEMTRLSGTVVDQAALHGVLAKLRDLGLPILGVRRLPGDEAR